MTPTHNTHLSSAVCAQARNAHTSRLAQELHCPSFCAWKELSHLVCCMSHPWLSHLLFTTSKSSSSSPTFPTTHREHPVHHAHLQAPSVDKLRHQESLWREDLQSGGNPRTTTPTGYEPKELATVSRIEAYSGGPYQLYDVHEKVGEEDHRAPITEVVEEFGEIGTAGLRDSQISETSYFQSQMHFDDSVESIAECDLEDGELQKMLTSPRKLRRNPMQWSCRREVSAQYPQADRKQSLRCHSSEGQEGFGKPQCIHCFHLNRETWSGVLCSETLIRRIWEDLFLKVTRITCSIRRDQTFRSKSFMSSPSISASVNWNDKRKSKDWHHRTHNTD